MSQSQSQHSEEGETTIDLIITDMRESVFRVLPENERVQKDFKLDNVYIEKINPGESFRILLALIKSKLLVDSDFVVCTPDSEVISATNVNILRSGDSLIVLDCQTQLLPIEYNQTVNATPHSRAVTNMDGAFYGKEEHNVAAFALAELVDNSLSATDKNEGDRRIEIRYYENRDESTIHVLDNGSGMNTDTLKEGLKYKAPKTHREFNTRNFTNSGGLIHRRRSDITFPNGDNAEDVHPRYINSNISKFGAGMKHCAFYLGEYLRVITKRAEANSVRDVILSKSDLERMEESHGQEKPWHLPMKSRNVGEATECQQMQKVDRKHVPWLTQRLIEEERGKSNFTHIILGKLKGGGDSSPLEYIRRREKNGTSIEQQLAHVYHYYIHGREGIRHYSHGQVPVSQEKCVDIIVSRFMIRDNEAIPVSSVNLREIRSPNEMEDLESKFIRTAEDTFRFTIEVSHWETGVSGTPKAKKPFKVGGLIRYHPCHFDGETHPEGFLSRRSVNRIGSFEEVEEEILPEVTEGDSDGGEGQNSEYPLTVPSSTNRPNTTDSNITRKCKDFFHVWWNGRLIPITRLDSFDWCSPYSRMNPSNPLYKCYDRISGSLFFDSSVEDVAFNKLFITTKDLMNMFNEKRIGGKQATFLRVTGTGSNVKGKRMNVKEDFLKWLKKTHRNCDKQVKYYEYMGKTEKTVKFCNSAKIYHKFKKAVWDISLTVGDTVKCNRRKPHIIGRIVCFLLETDNVKVEESGHKPTGAPLSLVQIEQLPEALFGEDSIITKCMSEIDTTLTINAVKVLIMEMEKKLEMKLVLSDWFGEELMEGAEIPMDSVLIKKLRIKIRGTSENKEIMGTLFHPTTAKGKKIYLVGRVYRIFDDGSQDIFYTTNICQWNVPYKGYFFKSINLRQTLIEEPGDYGIKFLSYVDVPEHHLKSKSKSRGGHSRSRSRPATSSSSSSAVMGQDLEEAMDEGLDIQQTNEEEEEGVDSIGRHTLKCGGKMIPLPIHKGITFKVVAGTPHKFSIYSIGEENDLEFKIGQPFDVTLQFEDIKGNPTKPASCDALIPTDLDTPILFVTQSSLKSAPRNIDIKFDCREIIPYNDQVIIRDVVARGFLGEGAFYVDCKVAVRLQWTPRKIETCAPQKVRFSTGTPSTIKVVEEQIIVENGDFPILTCEVTDSCGNMVTHTADKKPIVLTYIICKGGYVDLTNQFCSGTTLAAQARGESQKLNAQIDLPELKNGDKKKVRLMCQVSFGELESDMVPIKAIPSKRPETLRIYLKRSEGVQREEVTPGIEVKRKVNLPIKGLTFGIFNGLQKEVELDASKYKLDFSWLKTISKKAHCKTYFENGLLPTMEIPKTAENRRECSTTLLSRTPLIPPLNVIHKFYVTTLPLRPHDLKVNVKGLSSSDRVNVPVDGISKLEIIVSVLDEHKNVLSKFDDRTLQQVEIETVDLCTSFVIIGYKDVEIERNEGSFLIHQLKFTGGTPSIGDRDITFKYGSIHAILQLKILPGKPAALAFEVDNEMQTNLERRRTGNPCFVLPNQTNARIRVHLKDSYGNNVRMDMVTVFLAVGSKMNEGKPIGAATNSEGIVDFNFINIGVKSGEIPTHCESPGGNFCGKKCFNLHNLTAKCLNFGDIPIIADCGFHIKCRDDIPVKLSFCDSINLVCTASDYVDGFTARVEAEDESTITFAKLEDLTATMTSEVAPGIPITVHQWNPVAVVDGIYSFDRVPKEAGRFRLDFNFNDGRTSFTHRFTKLVRILCLDVDSLEPENNFNSGENICVSNDPDNPERRTVARRLTLFLKDQYKNIVKNFLTDSEMKDEDMEDKLNGKVTVHMVRSSNKIFFQNEETIFSNQVHELINGMVIFPDIILVPRVSIPNKSKFSMKFVARLQNHKIITHILEFLFFDDVAQQQEIQGLETARTNALEQIIQIESQFKNYDQELNKLKNEQAQALSSENQIRGLFLAADVDLQTNRNIGAYESTLISQQKKLEHQRLGTQSNVEHWEAGQDYFGVIGLLAQVKSEGGGLYPDIQLQTVLSWYLQSYLSVIVTLSSGKGLEYEREYGHQKQFMLLDQVRVGGMNWDDEIPEGLRQYGNAKYARSLLYLTKTDPQSVVFSQKIFNKILGRTVIVNTLADATKFRKACNAGGFPTLGWCPAIITRDGRRIKDDAVIGGNQNRAPHLDKLRYKFGLAPNLELTKISNQLKGLSRLTAALEARIRTKDTLTKYIVVHKERMAKLREDLQTRNLQKVDAETKLSELNQEILNQTQKWNLQSPLESQMHRLSDSEMEVSSTSVTENGLTPAKPAMTSATEKQVRRQSEEGFVSGPGTPVKRARR